MFICMTNFTVNTNSNVFMIVTTHAGKMTCKRSPHMFDLAALTCQHGIGKTANIISIAGFGVSLVWHPPQPAWQSGNQMFHQAALIWQHGIAGLGVSLSGNFHKQHVTAGCRKEKKRKVDAIERHNRSLCL